MCSTAVVAKLLTVISCGRRSERFEELLQYHRCRQHELAISSGFRGSSESFDGGHDKRSSRVRIDVAGAPSVVSRGHVSDDRWQIKGCPVNGPAADFRDDLVVVAWYTSPNDESNPHVPIAQITTSPFSAGVTLGTFTFVRQP